jgi:hypothetical protein
MGDPRSWSEYGLTLLLGPGFHSPSSFLELWSDHSWWSAATDQLWHGEPAVLIYITIPKQFETK